MKTKCPACTSPMTEYNHGDELTFRGEVFKVRTPCYICSNCGERFTSGPMTQEALNEAARQYAKKHGVDVNTLPIYSADYLGF